MFVGLTCVPSLFWPSFVFTHDPDTETLQLNVGSYRSSRQVRALRHQVEEEESLYSQPASRPVQSCCLCLCLQRPQTSGQDSFGPHMMEGGELDRDSVSVCYQRATSL